MFESIANFWHESSSAHMNVLGLLGLALFGGALGGRIFERIRVPQVVGYLVIGILIGRSGLGWIDTSTIEILEPMNVFALGLIGFMIGSELKWSVLKSYGTQFVTILLCEGIISFAVVTLLLGCLGTLMLPATIVWPFAILMGAIASATAPAATTDVLWEYKTRGPLTTTIFGIVAMDDALALILFAIASAVASTLMHTSDLSPLMTIWHPIQEVLGASAIGLTVGVVLNFLVKHYAQADRILVLTIGMVLITIGLADFLHVETLLAAMVLGVVVVNGLPKRSKEVFRVVSTVTPPIYILFFVMVGAKLNSAYLSLSVCGLVLLYLFGRSLGKILGAWLGATLAHSRKSVRHYLPFCLFSQAGVAIGLSMMAHDRYPDELGNAIVAVITASTLVVQLIGPSSVKWAVTKAGELGLNLTSEDLMKRVRVKELMDPRPPILYRSTPQSVILKTFRDCELANCPVIDDQGKPVGVITFEGLKQTFLEADSELLYMASDLMVAPAVMATPDMFAEEAKALFATHQLEYLPVLDKAGVMVGFLEERRLDRLLTARVMELRERIQANEK